MERKSFRLREYPAIAKLAQMYVENNGMSYKDAIKKAKESIGSERVGAHIDSDSTNSKEYKDSISLDEDIDNGEIYNIETGETVGEL